MRCFTGQLAYLDKTKRNLINPTAKRLNSAPIACSFENEYRDVHCGTKDKKGPLEVVAPDSTKKCQVILGRTVVGLRTGLHLCCAQRRYSSCSFYPMVGKSLRNIRKVRGR